MWSKDLPCWRNWSAVSHGAGVNLQCQGLGPFVRPIIPVVAQSVLDVLGVPDGRAFQSSALGAGGWGLAPRPVGLLPVDAERSGKSILLERPVDIGLLSLGERHHLEWRPLARASEGTIPHSHCEYDFATSHLDGVDPFGFSLGVESVVELDADAAKLAAPAHESVTERDRHHRPGSR